MLLLLHVVSNQRTASVPRRVMPLLLVKLLLLLLLPHHRLVLDGVRVLGCRAPPHPLIFVHHRHSVCDLLIIARRVPVHGVPPVMLLLLRLLQ